MTTRSLIPHVMILALLTSATALFASASTVVPYRNAPDSPPQGPWSFRCSGCGGALVAGDGGMPYCRRCQLTFGKWEEGSPGYRLPWMNREPYLDKIPQTGAERVIAIFLIVTIGGLFALGMWRLGFGDQQEVPSPRFCVAPDTRLDLDYAVLTTATQRTTPAVIGCISADPSTLTPANGTMPAMATPNVERSYWGVSLGTTKAAVRDLKGEPSEVLEGHWIYRGQFPPPARGYQYMIAFSDDRVALIFGIRPDEPLQGIWQYSSLLKRVQEKFGEPTEVRTPDDNLTRIFWYDKYNVFFLFRHDLVVALGIYDPHTYRNALSAIPDVNARDHNEPK